LLLNMAVLWFALEVVYLVEGSQYQLQFQKSITISIGILNFIKLNNGRKSYF
jgi:ABC-type uncharacterized transport system involved in gliding motility auxiliary subunit